MEMGTNKNVLDCKNKRVETKVYSLCDKNYKIRKNPQNPHHHHQCECEREKDKEKGGESDEKYKITWRTSGFYYRNCRPPTLPPPPPQKLLSNNNDDQFKPLMVCYECGCAFQMKDPESSPNFKELFSKGYALDIRPPNSQNVTYFAIMKRAFTKVPVSMMSMKHIPKKVFCMCPLCRPKNRPGNHFNNCTCCLCLSRTQFCNNYLRYELLRMLRERRGRVVHPQNQNETKVEKEEVKNNENDKEKENEEPEEKEQEPDFSRPRNDPMLCSGEMLCQYVPLRRRLNCPCHFSLCWDWVLYDPCPSQIEFSNKFTKISCLSTRSSFENDDKSHYDEGEDDYLEEFVTPSLSQQYWPEDDDDCLNNNERNYSSIEYESEDEDEGSLKNYERDYRQFNVSIPIARPAQIKKECSGFSKADKNLSGNKSRDKNIRGARDDNGNKNKFGRKVDMSEEDLRENLIKFPKLKSAIPARKPEDLQSGGGSVSSKEKKNSDNETADVAKTKNKK